MNIEEYKTELENYRDRIRELKKGYEVTRNNLIKSQSKTNNTQVRFWELNGRSASLFKVIQDLEELLK